MARVCMYFKIRYSMFRLCKRERSQWLLQVFYPDNLEMETLFPRWIARGADFHRGEVGRRESEFKKGEELGVHVWTYSA